MERDIAIALLLLVGLTWLLYKLTVLLEPEGQKNGNSAPVNGVGAASDVRGGAQKHINQRLKK